jgi:hypothetical protein
MLLHIDGSRHQWFQDERWYDLIVILDDATSEIYYAQLVEEESTVTVMEELREVIERKGVFCAPSRFPFRMKRSPARRTISQATRVQQPLVAWSLVSTSAGQLCAKCTGGVLEEVESTAIRSVL